MKTLPLRIICFLLLVSGAFAQSPSLTDEISRLKQENQQLRLENQRLRQLVAQPTAPQAPIAASQAQAATVQAPNDNQGLSYWLTTSSNKRHNSRCKWYRNSNGRPCGPNEGIPCKICGG